MNLLYFEQQRKLFKHTQKKNPKSVVQSLRLFIKTDDKTFLYLFLCAHVLLPALLAKYLMDLWADFTELL